VYCAEHHVLFQQNHVGGIIMKKITAIFLCMFLHLCNAAYAEDGIVGLWRYEYNDNITLFSLMEDNTYKMVISTNDQQGATLTGKYRVSGGVIIMTENVFEGERTQDFSYSYEVNGDIAMFDDYEYVRVAKEDSAAMDIYENK